MKSKKCGRNENGKRVSVSNRKYLGSKRELAPRIIDKILSTSGLPEVFFDGFVGTGAVAAAMVMAGVKEIIACDNLLTNTVVFGGAFALPSSQAALFDEKRTAFNALPGRRGYITDNYADKYFTRSNCLFMDAVREEIASVKSSGDLPGGVTDALLASFILGADRVANTIGQYDAYMKHLGSQGMENGRHLVDVRVYEKFFLPQLMTMPPIKRDIYTADIFSVIDGVTADTAYLDPPYNGRQYCDNYHVLENLARWEKPSLSGKTRKFDRTSLKSVFSRKRTAADALHQLVERLRADHVYLSYNSEGILTKTQIESAIGSARLQACWEFPYPVFGRGAGVSRKRTVTEYLFYYRNA